MDPIDIKELTGNSSRNHSGRKVTAAQVDAPTHVAIAVWEEQWDSAPHGMVSGWVTVFDNGRTRPYINSGTTRDKDPNPHILRKLQAAMKKLRLKPDQIWLVVGSRRAPLAGLLEKNGFSVTRAFSEQNRASTKAAKLRTRQARDFARKAKKQGEAPLVKEKSVQPAQRLMWLPNSSRNAGVGGRMPTIWLSCDASSDTNTRGSMCFVASNGDYQLRTLETKASTNELEVEAITMALQYVARAKAQKAVIESDSDNALNLVSYLFSGKNSSKRHKGVSMGARDRFLTAWKEANEHADVEIQRVLGHAGDPLNAAADKIAYMALRATIHPKRQAKPTLDSAIHKTLRAASAEASKHSHEKVTAMVPEKATQRKQAGRAPENKGTEAQRTKAQGTPQRNRSRRRRPRRTQRTARQPERG